MIIQPKVRGFVCITSHPTGCAAHVQEQIDSVLQQPVSESGPKRVLIVGASTGYGLSSRIVSAFGYGAETIGVFFERPPTETRPASAGWYNTAAFEQAVAEKGLWTQSFNGDAFSNEVKAQTIAEIKERWGQVDLVVYSLASPRRTDPKDGQTYSSTLKPIGQPFTSKTLLTDKKIVTEVSIDPASEEEIAHTVKVMGGEDWELWIKALMESDALAPGCKTVAYDYIGPEHTWPIYRNGTIGQAKRDLKATADRLNQALQGQNGQAVLSVNKAVVTQASSAIPVVPLYISILFKVMKEMGLHEGTTEQINRLFRERLYAEGEVEVDEEGRIRIDDWEMKPEVQAKVAAIWPQLTTESLDELTDFATYQRDFLKLFGFRVEGIDYEAEVDPNVPIPSLQD